VSSYFLLVPQLAESGLVARLERLIKLHPIEMGVASQTIASGDVCFASGESMATLLDNERGQIISSILQKSAHLVIIPPFPGDPWPWLLRNVPPPEFYAASFGPVTIVEEELRRLCDQDQLTVLYNQAICFSMGNPVVVTSEGDPVIVRYQHRSSWGQIIYMTLILGSTSSRSQRTHRLALAQGLVNWLTQISRKAMVSIPSAPNAAPDFTYELPIVLMAVHLAQQDGELLEEQIKPVVDKVRAKLSCHRDDFQLSKTLAQLEAMEILFPQGEGRWLVAPQRLTEEISRQHLTSYLRRLR